MCTLCKVAAFYTLIAVNAILLINVVSYDIYCMYMHAAQ